MGDKGRKKGTQAPSGILPGMQSSLPPLPAPGPVAPGISTTTRGRSVVSVAGSLVAPAGAQMTLPDGADPLAEFFHDDARDGNVTETEMIVDEELERLEERERVLVFGLGQEEYGLEIMEVREILKPPVLTEVPRAPLHVLGVFSLRGLVLPVLSLTDILGVPGDASGGGTDARVLVVGRGEESVALWVHRVAQVVKMNTRALEPPPGGLSANRRALLRGLGRQDDRLIIVLDLPQLMIHLGLTGGSRVPA